MSDTKRTEIEPIAHELLASLKAMVIHVDRAKLAWDTDVALALKHAYAAIERADKVFGIGQKAGE